MKARIVFLMVALVGGMRLTAQDYLYVSPAGTNDAAGKYPNWSGAATSIQEAVNAAADGDVILVTNLATYRFATNIAVFKPVTVRSYAPGGGEDPDTAIIDGQNNSACFYISHTGAWVSGFTITNGNGLGGTNSNVGGGVSLGYGAAGGGTLSNCIVAGNTAPVGAGGIYASGSGALVTDCRIAGNTAGVPDNTYRGGGGIAMYYGTIRRCVIDGNQSLGGASYQGGGGVCLQNGGVLDDCLVVSNKAKSGGGIFVVISGSITNCRVRSNESTNPASLTYSGGGIFAYLPAGVEVVGCEISGNRGDYGGGIFSRQHDHMQAVYIRNSSFISNTALAGGGFYQNPSASTTDATNYLDDCVFEGNTASNYGGGISVRQGGIMVNRCELRNNANGGFGMADNGVTMRVIRNSLIEGNFATSAVAPNAGAGILNNGALMLNCTVVSNRAENGNCGGVWLYGAGASITNTIMRYNYGSDLGTEANYRTATYSGNPSNIAWSCTFPTNGLGVQNIEADPQFRSLAGQDYRLQGASPCVNAGLKESWMEDAADLDGRRRIDRFSRMVDLGCYEYLPSGMFLNVR